LFRKILQCLDRQQLMKRPAEAVGDRQGGSERQ